MRAVLKFVFNLLLALFLVACATAILSVGYASVMAHRWETATLDEYADGGEWLWIAERPYHYQTWGPDEGPTVVFIHGGYVEGSRTWEQNAWDVSRSGIRVVAVDLAGLGFSSRDTSQDFSLTGQAQLVAMMLNELRVTGATVVGHDYGAAVALELAQIQPQFVGSVALVAPQLDAEAWPVWRPWAPFSYLGNGFAWGLDCGGPLWGRRVRQNFASDDLARAYVEGIKPMTHIEGTIDALMAIAQTDEQGLRQNWKSLDVPSLVLLGDSDPWLQAGEVEAQFPDADFQLIEGAGHMPHVEASGDVNRFLVQFCLGQ